MAHSASGWGAHKNECPPRFRQITVHLAEVGTKMSAPPDFYYGRVITGVEIYHISWNGSIYSILNQFTWGGWNNLADWWQLQAGQPFPVQEALLTLVTSWTTFPSAKGTLDPSYKTTFPSAKGTPDTIDHLQFFSTLNIFLILDHRQAEAGSVHTDTNAPGIFYSPEKYATFF